MSGFVPPKKKDISPEAQEILRRLTGNFAGFDLPNAVDREIALLENGPPDALRDRRLSATRKIGERAAAGEELIPDLRGLATSSDASATILYEMEALLRLICRRLDGDG